MKIVSVNQMQIIEKQADRDGLSYQAMMDNAGMGVADWVLTNLPLQNGVIGLVGSGNNGGDTIIALKNLSKHGVRTIAFLVKQRHEDILIDDYLSAGGSIVDISQNENLGYLEAMLKPDVVVLDGILGTGLKLPIRGVLHVVMANVHELLKHCPGARIIAVDCPSGVDCDTGEVSKVTFRANDTLCMAAIKQGLLKHPGRSTAGQLHMIEIGIDDISKYVAGQLAEMINQNLIQKFFPLRPSNGHKGTFGTCLVLAGTTAYTGAAFLSGKAAYLGGCGLVHIATLKEVHQSLSGQLVEAVWSVIPGMHDGYDPTGANILADELAKADALVVGPGWGLSDENLSFLEAVLEVIPPKLPTLFDADGLKLLSQLDDWWNRLPGDTVLTPHPGEMAIMTGIGIDEIQSSRWEIVCEYAKHWGVILLLKGAVSVIATPDGDLFINPVSEPALATAGSGDVLSGLIGGLLAQGLSARSATILGVWLHAQAGVIAHAYSGTDISVTARDILECIPEANYQQKRPVSR